MLQHSSDISVQNLKKLFYSFLTSFHCTTGRRNSPASDFSRACHRGRVVFLVARWYEIIRRHGNAHIAARLGRCVHLEPLPGSAPDLNLHEPVWNLLPAEWIVEAICGRFLGICAVYRASLARAWSSWICQSLLWTMITHKCPGNAENAGRM